MNFVQEELIINQLVLQIFPVFSRAIKYRGQEKDSADPYSKFK